MIPEDNLRVSKNHRQFLISTKGFYNLKQMRNQLNAFSKTDSLQLKADQMARATGLRSELSKFNGWVTVDEAKGMTRKNAPETEIGK